MLLTKWWNVVYLLALISLMWCRLINIISGLFRCGRTISVTGLLHPVIAAICKTAVGFHDILELQLCNIIPKSHAGNWVTFTLEIYYIRGLLHKIQIDISYLINKTKNPTELWIVETESMYCCTRVGVEVDGVDITQYLMRITFM